MRENFPAAVLAIEDSCVAIHLTVLLYFAAAVFTIGQMPLSGSAKRRYLL